MEHAAVTVIKTLRNAGYQAFFVGGYVRDKLMGTESNDIDIATNATSKETQKLFDHCVTVGESFGVTVVIVGDYQFEVAMFRTDGHYIDGRRPVDVMSGTIYDDAKRRDFTINGMYYDPITDEIHDLVGGKQDIVGGVIRAIGDPMSRFEEDKLRMIRAIRFACRYGYSIEPSTLQAIKLGKIGTSVARERIWEELKKMYSCKREGAFKKALELMNDTGLSTQIFGEPVDIEKIPIICTAKSPCAIFAYIGHRFAKLFPLSKREQSWISTWLKIPTEISDRYSWFRYFRELDSDDCLLAGNIRRTRDDLLWHLEHQPIIKGTDIIGNFPIAKGKIFGDLLSHAEKYSVNNDVRDRAQLIDELRLFSPPG